MKQSAKRLLRIALQALLVVLALVVYGVYQLNELDGTIPVTPVQMALKPGAVEISSAAIDRAPFLYYLNEHAQAPVDYVVEKFRTHDVVMLGEAHQIREDYEFISQLIEPLYRRAGVRVLAMEVLKQKHVPELNRLLNAPSYDESRIIQIFREDYFYWGYQEYLDILKSVWAFNRTLSPSEPHFEVVGLMPDFDVYRITCGSLWQKILEFPRIFGEEEGYARPVREALDRNQKVLVQVGYFHTFVNYRLPKVIEGRLRGELKRMRFGMLLKQTYGDRVFQIAMHVRHDPSPVYTEPPLTPLPAFLEQLYEEINHGSFGFDVANSPFAMLRDSSDHLFKYQPYVTFGDLAQGYIILKPYTQLHCVKWIPGFVNQSNLLALRTYSIQHEIIAVPECQTAAELEQRFSNLLAEGRRFD